MLPCSGPSPRALHSACPRLRFGGLGPSSPACFQAMPASTCHLCRHQVTEVSAPHGPFSPLSPTVPPACDRTPTNRSSGILVRTLCPWRARTSSMRYGEAILRHRGRAGSASRSDATKQSPRGPQAPRLYTNTLLRYSPPVAGRRALCACRPGRRWARYSQTARAEAAGRGRAACGAYRQCLRVPPAEPCRASPAQGGDGCASRLRRPRCRPGLSRWALPLGRGRCWHADRRHDSTRATHGATQNRGGECLIPPSGLPQRRRRLSLAPARASAPVHKLRNCAVSDTQDRRGLGELGSTRRRRAQQQPGQPVDFISRSSCLPGTAPLAA